MALLTGDKSFQSRNASATLAFHKYRKVQDEGNEQASERASIIRIGVEKVGSEKSPKYKAKLHLEIAKCFTIMGPLRENKQEAVCDGLELGRVYVSEGTSSAKRCAQNLGSRKWSEKDQEEVDQRDLEGFSLPGTMLGGQSASSRYLIPPGEGWTRYEEDMSIHTMSQVIFVQVGDRAGEYLKRSAETKRLEEVGVPHKPQVYEVKLAGSSASVVRKGAKLDRAVILPDIAKIARLALKFPLTFVDTPASAYALFQGHRSSEAAQWCAENFHKKLLPILGEKIHTYDTWELQDVLHRTLQALDSELLKANHAFSGCSALLALVLGERLVVAGVGRVHAVLLPENPKKPAQPLLLGTGCLDDRPDAAGASAEERERVVDAGGILRGGLVFTPTGNQAELDEAARILAAHSPFEVLQIEVTDVFDQSKVRSAYRKLALRVHPDKQAEGANLAAYKAAFARLDSAKDKLEEISQAEKASLIELHQVLGAEIHTRAGVTAFLGTEDLDDAKKAIKAVGRTIDKLRHLASALPLCDKAVEVCNEALATLERGFSVEALPRQEACLKEGLSASRAMGARDLRFPHPIVQMKPETAAVTIPSDGRYRLALLCGATAAHSESHLRESTAKLVRQQKASALRWCSDSEEAAASASAICICMDATGGRVPEAGPPVKRAKSAGTGPEGTVRVRHILFRHGQLKQPDPGARREGKAKTVQEAELAALAALEKLVVDPNQWLKLCRELSDCQTGGQPGMLSGDLGWLGRGQQEQSFDDVAFSLAPNQFGDLVTGWRGVHIIQRLA